MKHFDCLACRSPAGLFLRKSLQGLIDGDLSTRRATKHLDLQSRARGRLVKIAPERGVVLARYTHSFDLLEGQQGLKFLTSLVEA